MSARRCRDRRGYTLLEMLAVMTAFSLLLVINTKWLHETMKFSSKTNRLVQQNRTLQRLDAVLRKDVHRSLTMKIDNSNTLKLTHDDGSGISYTINKFEIHVTKKNGDKIISRDRFDFGNHAIINWDESEMPNWVSLTIRRRDRYQHAGGKTADPVPDALASAGTTGSTEQGISAPRQTPKLEYHMRTGPKPWK